MSNSPAATTDEEFDDVGIMEEKSDEVLALEDELAIAYQVIESLNRFTPFWLSQEVTGYLRGDFTQVPKILDYKKRK